MCTEGIQGFLLARLVLYQLGYVHVSPLRHRFSELGQNVSGADCVCTITGLESKLLLGQTKKMKITFRREQSDTAIADEYLGQFEQHVPVIGRDEDPL